MKNCPIHGAQRLTMGGACEQCAAGAREFREQYRRPGVRLLAGVLLPGDPDEDRSLDGMYPYGELTE